MTPTSVNSTRPVLSQRVRRPTISSRILGCRRVPGGPTGLRGRGSPGRFLSSILLCSAKQKGSFTGALELRETPTPVLILTDEICREASESHVRPCRRGSPSLCAEQAKGQCPNSRFTPFPCRSVSPLVRQWTAMGCRLRQAALLLNPSAQARSKIAAMPWPPPMHIVTSA